MDRITTQYIPFDVVITALHEHHLINTFYMVDTISKKQLSELISEPHGGKGLLNIIDYAIGDRLYPPLCFEHYKLL